MRTPTQAPARLLGRAGARPLHPPLTRWSGSRWSSAGRSLNDGDRKFSTPLAKSLAEAIAATGPISVAAYMRQVLTAPNGGYYTSHIELRDQFGPSGDFITSPEVSQIFGEIVGLWFVAEWMAQGRKNKEAQLVEVGPGRGTLMDDMLRTIQRFKAMASAIQTIYLIETSPNLRTAQHTLLCGDAPVKETDIGLESTTKQLNCKVIWCEDIRIVPKDSTNNPFIVAHEFFDALPIHIFESISSPTPMNSSASPEPGVDSADPASMAAVARQQHRKRHRASSNQWRELLVSPVPAQSTHATLNTPLLLRDASPIPDFQLVQSQAPTPHSMYLPYTSERYEPLLQRLGSVIEVSPESLAYAADFAVRIGGGPVRPTATTAQAQQQHTSKPRPSGAALILDYGPLSTVPANSLRGVRRHSAVLPLALPGLVDVSADVDFVALAEVAVSASPGVEVHGPVEQATFLNAMGVLERADMLTRQAGDIESRERIGEGVQRLTDRGPNGMGRVFKALAILPHFPGRAGRRPVGFGGDVQV